MQLPQRVQCRPFVMVLLAWLIVSLPAASQELPKPLRRVAELFIEMSPRIASGLPIILDAQVCVALPDGQGFYALDGSRAIKVITEKVRPPMPPGTRIRIQGRSAMGSALPYVNEAQVEVLGPGRLPKPRPLGMLPTERMISGEEPQTPARIFGLEEGRWASLEGVVRVLRQEGNRLHFVLAVESNILHGSVENWKSTGSQTPTIGSRVRVEALCQAGETRLGTIRNFTLLVPDTSHFKRLAPGPEDVFGLPLTSIRDFLQNESSFPESRMVHVRGSITRQRPGVSMFIQDDSGSLFVRSDHKEPLELGDRVDVVGFPSYLRIRPCLSDGVFRRLGPGPPVVPLPLSPEVAGEFNLDGVLIELEGRLLDVVHEPPFNILVMTRGTRVFDAVLEQEKWDPAFDRLRVGSLLKTSGVCILKPRGPLSPAFFQMALRSKQDVQLVEAPPWWTRAFAVNLVHIIIILALLALVWIWSLRRRVALQTHRMLQENEARRRLENELQQVQKMESVGMLAGGVAHDFNNLLTVIQNYVGMVLDEPDMSPSVAKALRSIQGASQRAANLTRQLLTFGRRQVMNLQPLELNEAVSHFYGMMKSLVGETIELNCDLSPGLPSVHADLGMIEQVLMNLVVNARDAMPKGGCITLRTYTVAPLELALCTHDRVCLEVRDTGEGIPEETLPHIFEPFYSTKERHRGTGLGLATVHAIIQQHQGQIVVESRLGEGSCFRVYLPGHADLPVPQSEPSEPSASLQGGQERILLVEDDPELLQGTQQVLESVGYRVTSATSGDAALELWISRQGAFDLLLTDLVMPGELSGIQLAEELLVRKPDLKLILSTGYSEELLGAQGQALLRRVGFLPKPYTVQALAKCVREQLDGQ